MRLDHLLSKEFIIFCVEHALFLGGCTPSPSGGGVAADGKAWKEIVWCFTLLKEKGALVHCWVSGTALFALCVACCFLLHVGLLAVMVVGDCVWGVLFENCIVDASIFIF